MKEKRHDIRGKIAICHRDFMTEPASAMLGRIQKVPGPRPGHRPAGQEKKGIPFEMALLAEYICYN